MTTDTHVAFRKNARQNRASIKTIALGRRLATLRKQTGMTQSDLAHQIGWLPGQVARIEAGYHELTVRTFMAYLRGLGITRFDFGDFQ